jgi:2-polyprenyl-3-methyl-5-hydroxy-6-metoxy-1,4-benzoquinol methylase
MTGPCPLCSGAVFSTWRFGLVTCRSCGLVVTTEVWRPAANEVLNAAFFDDEQEPVVSFWTRLFERMNNRRTLSRLLDGGNPARGKLLEVGVGSGSLLTAARSHGYSPCGCDISAAACRRISRTPGVSVYCGLLQSFPGDDLFDVIVMNHLLEHVADPVALLNAARKRLRSGGVLHVAVPNVGSWEAAWPGWNSYERYHLLYFTPDTLQIAAQKAGFDILSVVTHESFSGWFLALFRTLRRQRLPHHSSMAHQSKRTSVVIEALYRLAMIGAGALTLPMRRLQGALGRGDEVILLCSNPFHE